MSMDQSRNRFSRLAWARLNNEWREEMGPYRSGLAQA